MKMKEKKRFPDVILFHTRIQNITSSSRPSTIQLNHFMIHSTYKHKLYVLHMFGKSKYV